MTDSHFDRASGELPRRVASALVLGPAALGAAWIGGSLFAGVIITVGLLAYREWVVISGSGPSWLALGLACIAIPSGGLIALRLGGSSGLMAVIFLFVVVWATDIAAYFGGRAIGGAKLWPLVSPKKTWAGALVGLAAALACAAVLAAIFDPQAAWRWVWVAGLLSLAAQCGDLAESAFKRRFGVKDSGSIIPGHGGVLDRVDGLYGAAALGLALALGGAGGPLPNLTAAGLG